LRQQVNSGKEGGSCCLSQRSHPLSFQIEVDRTNVLKVLFCRSGGGWSGWTKDATLLSVWRHSQHSQPYGKHRRRYTVC